MTGNRLNIAGAARPRKGDKNGNKHAAGLSERYRRPENALV